MNTSLSAISKILSFASTAQVNDGENVGAKSTKVSFRY
jgi:hypothetical protein